MTPGEPEAPAPAPLGWLLRLGGRAAVSSVLAVLVLGWEILSRAVGRQSTPEFMMDVLKSARGDGVLWLLVVAFCIAAPISEEFFARGFLYRGWSETFLGVPGAVVLSTSARRRKSAMMGQ